MVMLALVLAVIVTFTVWIRRPEQKMINRLSSEMRLSAAFAKPGEKLELTVMVNNEKSLAVPILRVDIDLPEELIFADGGDENLPRHRSHICTIDGNETLTFTHTISAQREGKVAIEAPELIVYSLTGAIVANNAGERGKTAARLRIRLHEEA